MQSWRQGFRRRLTYSYARVGYRISVGSSGAASVFRSGVGLQPATKRTRGFSTGALPPSLHISARLKLEVLLLVCWRLRFQACAAGDTSRPIAHKKAAISRAIAVTATVLVLPAMMSLR